MNTMDYMLYGQMILTVVVGLFGATMLVLSIGSSGHEKTHYLIAGFGSAIISMILTMA